MVTKSSFLPISTDAQGNISCGGGSSGSVWFFPLGLVVAASLLLYIFHPPLLIVVCLGWAVEAVNVATVLKVGTSNVPPWVWVVVVVQGYFALRDTFALLGFRVH